MNHEIDLKQAVSLLHMSPFVLRDKAIPGLRDTGASLHNGIEPPTRGFSIRLARFLAYINQRVTIPIDAPIAAQCITMQHSTTQNSRKS